MEGQWHYRSLTAVKPLAASSIAASWTELTQWSPFALPALVKVNTDGSGKIAGTLTFQTPGGSLTLALAGTVTAATTPTHPLYEPEGIRLTGTGGPSVNQLRGFFIKDKDNKIVCIVGTTVAEKNDPAKRPDGSSGPFVMTPVGP